MAKYNPFYDNHPGYHPGELGETFGDILYVVRRMQLIKLDTLNRQRTKLEREQKVRKDAYENLRGETAGTLGYHMSTRIYLWREKHVDITQLAKDDGVVLPSAANPPEVNAHLETLKGYLMYDADQMAIYPQGISWRAVLDLDGRCALRALQYTPINDLERLIMVANDWTVENNHSRLYLE